VLISPYFKLPADLDTWLASVSKNRRKKQRGYLRQLDSDFADNWSITAVTKPEELRAVLDHLVTLHQAKWIDTNKRGAFYAYGNMIPYYYDLMRVYLEQGWLRLYQLKVAGKTGVVLFSYQVRGRAYDQISGYDNTLTEIPIGHVMTQHSIEQAIQNGCDEYSFMWGEEPYKYSFGAENRYQQAFQIVRSPRVRFQNALLKRLQELRQRLRKPEPEVVPAPEPDSSTQE